MVVVIVGYGRMGRLVEEIATKRGHRVSSRIDPTGLGDYGEVTPRALDGADGVIEFALADGIIDRLKLYAEFGLSAVVGTTGWDGAVVEAKSIVERGQGALLKGSNFSLGAHLFFRFTAAAAQLLNQAEEYDVALTEYHHTGKADHPSGTALTAAQGILRELDRKKHIVRELPDGPLPAEALQLASVRVGAVPGVHEMRIDSIADFLTIRHEARNRSGFALGAVRGLEWLKGKRGWHDADEFIDDLLA